MKSENILEQISLLNEIQKSVLVFARDNDGITIKEMIKLAPRRGDTPARSLPAALSLNGLLRPASTKSKTQLWERNGSNLFFLTKKGAAIALELSPQKTKLMTKKTAKEALEPTIKKSWERACHCDNCGALIANNKLVHDQQSDCIKHLVNQISYMKEDLRVYVERIEKLEAQQGY